jgi:hypothetical protein
MLDTEVPFVLKSYDTKQVVTGDPGEGQSQTFDGIQGVCLRSLFINEIINVRVELHNMVTVESCVAVSELEMRILFRETELNGFLILKERKFFQGFFEMLNFTENLSKILVVIQIELWVKSMLCFESLELEDSCLTYLISLSFSFFWNFNFQEVIIGWICELKTVVIIHYSINNLFQL